MTPSTPRPPLSRWSFSHPYFPRSSAPDNIEAGCPHKRAPNSFAHFANLQRHAESRQGTTPRSDDAAAKHHAKPLAERSRTAAGQVTRQTQACLLYTSSATRPRHGPAERPVMVSIFFHYKRLEAQFCLESAPRFVGSSGPRCSACRPAGPHRQNPGARQPPHSYRCLLYTSRCV